MMTIIAVIIVVLSVVYPIIIQKINFGKHNILESIAVLIGMCLPFSLLVVFGVAAHLGE